MGFDGRFQWQTDDVAGDAYEYDVKNYMSEKQLVEDSGIHYVRIPSQDHCWPAPECVDQFIGLIKQMGIDNLWMHIHCHAGKGRTGSFLVMYDKMKNPDVPMKDIVIRQTMLGSSYMLYATDDSDNWKAPLYAEKVEMTYKFEEYVNENKDTNYALPWSEWLKQQELEEAA